MRMWVQAAVAAGLLFGGTSGLGCAQQAGENPAGSFHLQMNVDRLLVPVVVRDHQGHSIDDLKQADFEVLDNGKPRDISGFLVERRRATSAGLPAGAAPGPDMASGPQETLPKRITVFLFDDMHLGVDDLAHARAAGIKVIDGALAGDGMAAVVSISGAVNSGLTRDRNALQEAMGKLSTHSLYNPDRIDCPYIDYYEADLIENKHDPIAVEDAVRKYFNCHPALTNPAEAGAANSPNAEALVDASAQRALSAGRTDVLSTLAGIAGLIKRMAPLPGRLSLVLISPGFLNVERESLDAESQIIDLAARANVTVSTLDARGLYVTELTASEKSPLLGGRSLQEASELHGSAMRLAENVMAELADGTGGTFFHNSNDLEAGLRELTDVPECLYLLELPIGDVKRNGSLHRLAVKVDRKGVDVSARRGYFVAKPEKKSK